MKCETHDRLRILHIVSGDLWAGAETMACNLLRRLKIYADLGITVILLNEGRLADELRAVDMAVHVIDEKRNSFSQILAKIRRIIISDPPHVIHSHRYKENILAFLSSRSRRGIRLVSTQHGLPEAYAKEPGLINRLVSNTNFFLLSRLFTTVAVSEDIRNALVKRYGFSNDRVDVIHNGIQLPPFTNLMEKTGPFVIGSSGRLFPVKDYPLMVEIARVMAGTGAGEGRFELAGDGPGMDSLRTLVNEYKLSDSFILKGHLDDMDSFYRGLNVYLNTSIHEGIPMTILEAMGHGLPVVAPAVGGIVEIIEDGKEGFLIDSRDPEAFAEKCLLLKDNRELRTVMSRAAREKAERAFSAERMAESYYLLYRRLLG